MINNLRNTKLALMAGATTLAALVPQAHAQSTDALIDKLVQKGILSENEAQDLRDESDQDFKTALQAKTGMPDWVTGYKFGGDIRGRYEQYSTPNPGQVANNSTGTSGMDHIRIRYRLRFGFTVDMEDNLEAGFRLGSADSSHTSDGGTPLSNSSTFQDDFSKKPIYVDTAYGKWTPLNDGSWTLATIIGKMDNPFQFTPMVFDPDLTPEGGAVQGVYRINDQHSITFATAAFILNDSYLNTYTNGNSQDPFLYGGQAMWNAKWSPKWSTSLGGGAFELVNDQSLGSTEVTGVNQGNTLKYNGALAYNFMPIIADGGVTYNCDTFPLYNGVFPITLSGEYMINPGAPTANHGYWGGITFGKSGTKRTWDLSYRYEYLESDAWYDQLVDDDNVAFYVNQPSNGGTVIPGTYVGYVGGTNIKGHLIRFNYSPTDSVVLSVTCYVNSLIDNPEEAQNNAIHFMADAMWKF